MSKAIPLLAALLVFVPTTVRADTEALLRTLAEGPHDQRTQAAADLADLGPKAVEALNAHLGRKRRHTEQQRRDVLAQVSAQVPDAKGRFVMPKRSSQEKRPDTDLDWLPALLQLAPDTPALGEVISDVAAIRALAATRDYSAGGLILEFAFTADGLVYRDECGRYLRKMSPYSLPGLIRASVSKTGAQANMGRYARYQLQRLDRESPYKALTNAPNGQVKIEILKAYNDVHHPDSVLAVLQTTDDVAPAVRAQARATWYGYVTGPPPPPAPKRKLTLPGGKLTEEEQPLYLTYREWAAVELKKQYEQALGKAPERRSSLKEQTDELFAFYDSRRADRLAARASRAQELAATDKLSEAVELYDGVLAQQPDHPAREQMAEVYARRADELSRERQWEAAAVAYGKTYLLAPESAGATRAQASQHYATGKALEAAGADGTPEFERALALDPKHPRAASALAGDDPDPTGPAADNDKRLWMVYAGAGLGVLALLLLIVGLRQRR